MNLQAERRCGADYFFIDVRSRSMSAVRIVVKIQPPEMTNMPTHPLLENGSGTFIPKKLVINVGTMSTRLMTVRRFMLTFKLFEMTD